MHDDDDDDDDDYNNDHSHHNNDSDNDYDGAGVPVGPQHRPSQLDGSGSERFNRQHMKRRELKLDIHHLTATLGYLSR